MTNETYSIYLGEFSGEYKKIEGIKRILGSYIESDNISLDVLRISGNPERFRLSAIIDSKVEMFTAQRKINEGLSRLIFDILGGIIELMSPVISNFKYKKDV